MEKKDIVFRCRKCDHLLFVSNINITKLKNIMEMECDACGEEGYENWILSRMGNYDVEYGDKQS